MAFFSMIKVLLLCTTSLSLLLTTPASGKGSNYLLSGESLQAGEALVDGDDKFIMQHDCDLVFYNSGVKNWSSGTGGVDFGCYVTLMEHGNLMIFNFKGIVWNRGPNGPMGKYILILQRDHNVFVYGPSFWSPIKSYESNDVVISAALNGTTGVSGEEQNNVKEMVKIMEVIGDE
ncbi:hypothetical protein IEQ34_005140 [Dendrobium chrysotoxum]|uniref:Bulb-type lectin domain-containing protein n=1 Tax=Dendrobium chrysotoxum TaxID=161865 RepID=A0AAV7H9A5_DENCH|nr:hypothetical protein IEQ34_005140 [Dendrobium chrysotoxum]